jgi:hypothetical protein
MASGNTAILASGRGMNIRKVGCLPNPARIAASACCATGVFLSGGSCATIASLFP